MIYVTLCQVSNDSVNGSTLIINHFYNKKRNPSTTKYSRLIDQYRITISSRFSGCRINTELFFQMKPQQRSEKCNKRRIKCTRNDYIQKKAFPNCFSLYVLLRDYAADDGLHRNLIYQRKYNDLIILTETAECSYAWQCQMNCFADVRRNESTILLSFVIVSHHVIE